MSREERRGEEKRGEGGRGREGGRERETRAVQVCLLYLLVIERGERERERESEGEGEREGEDTTGVCGFPKRK